jgi:hypothetical protein
LTLLQQAATDPEDWPEQTTNIAVIITAIVNSTSTVAAVVVEQ